MNKFENLLMQYGHDVLTDTEEREFNQVPLFNILVERDRKLLEALKEVASYGGSWETLVKNVFKELGEEI